MTNAVVMNIPCAQMITLKYHFALTDTKMSLKMADFISGQEMYKMNLEHLTRKHRNNQKFIGLGQKDSANWKRSPLTNKGTI